MRAVVSRYAGIFKKPRADPKYLIQEGDDRETPRQKKSSLPWLTPLRNALLIIYSLVLGAVFFTAWSVKTYVKALQTHYTSTVKGWARKGVMFSASSIDWCFLKRFPFMGVRWHDVTLQCTLPLGTKGVRSTVELQAPKMEATIGWTGRWPVSFALRSVELSQPHMVLQDKIDHAQLFQALQKRLTQTTSRSGQPTIHVVEGTVRTSNASAPLYTHLGMVWAKARGGTTLKLSSIIGDQPSSQIQFDYRDTSAGKAWTLQASHVVLQDHFLDALLTPKHHPLTQLTSSPLPVTGVIHAQNQDWTFDLQWDRGHMPGIPPLLQQGRCVGHAHKDRWDLQDLTLDFGAPGHYTFQGTWSYDNGQKQWQVQGQTTMTAPHKNFWGSLMQQGNPLSKLEGLGIEGSCIEWSTQGTKVHTPSSSTPLPLLIFFDTGVLVYRDVSFAPKKSSQPLAKGLKGTLEYSPNQWVAHIEQGSYGKWDLKGVEMHSASTGVLFKGHLKTLWPAVLKALTPQGIQEELTSLWQKGVLEGIGNGLWTEGSPTPTLTHWEGQVSQAQFGIRCGGLNLLLEQGKGSFQLTPDHISFKGGADCAKSPIKLKWMCDFHQKPWERQRLQILGETDPALLKSLGWDPGILWGQKASYRFLWAQQPHENYGVMASVDLKSSVLNLPLLNWFKLPGAPATLTLKGSCTPEGLAIQDASFKAESLSLEAEGLYDLKTQQWSHLDIRRLKAPEYHLSLKAYRSAEGGWHLHLQGKEASWHPDLLIVGSRLFGEGILEVVDVDLETLWHKHQLWGRGLKGDLAFENQQLSTAHLHVDTHPSGHTSLEISPSYAPPGSVQARLTSSAIKPLLNLVSDHHGWIQGHLHVEAQKNAEQGQWVGHVYLKNAVVNEVSLPAQLIGALSHAFESGSLQDSHCLIQQGGVDFMYHDVSGLHLGRGFLENTLMDLTFEGVAGLDELSIQGQMVSLPRSDQSTRRASSYTLTGSWREPMVSFVEQPTPVTPAPPALKESIHSAQPNAFDPFLSSDLKKIPLSPNVTVQKP